MKKYIILLNILFNFNTYAITNEQASQSGLKGVVYLVKNQNGDGSWGKEPEEKIRSTQQAIWALSKYHVGGIPLNRAVSWLYNAESSNPDSTSRLLLGLSQLSIEAPSLIRKLDDMSYVVKTPSGIDGKLWGAMPGYVPSTIDQAYALRAKLSADGKVDSEAMINWSSLLNSRRTGTASSQLGSGWSHASIVDIGYFSQHSSVTPTAEVLLTMFYMDKYSDSDLWDNNAVKHAVDWLILQQKKDGGFGDDISSVLETSLVLKTMHAVKTKQGSLSNEWKNAVNKAIDYIYAKQQVNGSWHNDIYTTALAIQGVTSQFSINNIDTDGDQLPDYLEALLPNLNPNIADAINLEKSNGYNYKDQSLLTSIQVQVIVNQYNEDKFPTVFDNFTTQLIGSLPKGLTFDKKLKTLKGIPNRTGSFLLTYKVELDNRILFVPVNLLVVNPWDDIDGDGMDAAYELKYSSILNPFDANDKNIDSDNDGVSNYDEFLAGTEPNGDTGQPVKITSTPILKFELGFTYSYVPESTPKNATFSLDKKPDGMVINNGQLIWRPLPKNISPGIYWVSVKPILSGYYSKNQQFLVEATLHDVDGDGMSDYWEAFHKVSEPGYDPDEDGITNLDEFLNGTNPNIKNNNTILSNDEDIPFIPAWAMAVLAVLLLRKNKVIKNIQR